MKKIKREDFESIAYGVISTGSAIATVAISYGVGFLGGVATCDSMGLFKRHPKITGIIGALTGAFASTMVCNSDRVAEYEINYAENASQELTNWIYGSDRVNIDKIIED